jgi:RHS repeat-associated protein
VIGSIASRLRLVAAPIAVLTVLSLQPDPAAARPPSAPERTAAGVAAGAVRQPGQDLPAEPAPGGGKAPAPCAPAKLRPASTTAIAPGRAVRVMHDEAQVALKAGAVKTGEPIVATSLCAEALAPMDQAMTNVTAAPRRGYRFEPSQTFASEATVTLPYDPALIPLGLTELDVYTYFYDETSLKWRALQRVAVDAQAHTVTSLTDHFTDFVNATLTVPDHPETASFDPTGIKNIEAASPSAKVNVIAPPQPNNGGTAALSYPIELPPGRAGVAPGIGLSYDSGRGNGWLGVGWDLPVPSVGIETRWGVPRYSATQETETYVLGAEQLTPLAHRGAPQPRTAEKVFHTRREGGFATIRRHGTNPRDYWWEVTEKDGTRWFYGGDPGAGQVAGAVLADPAGNVFRWALREMRDLNGNTIRYSYQAVSDAGLAGGTVPGRELYLRSINYTGTATAAGAYTVTFVRDSQLPGHTRRPDVLISGRGGFKQVTAELLARVEVAFNGSLVRRYDLGYTAGAFGKSLLESVTQRGGDGTAFNTHRFSYFDEVRDGGTYAGFAAPATWNSGDDQVDAGLLGQGRASALSGAVSTGVGGHAYVGFNPSSPTKRGSFGAKVGFTRSTNDGVLALVDLNGDSLPDKVFKQDGQLRFRLNTSGPDGSADFAAAATALPSLPGISAETSDTSSFGAEQYLIGNAFVNQATTFTEASTYFTDANADGLTDLVVDGQVRFNHLDANGVPTFTADSGDTPVRVDDGAVDPDGVIDDFESVRQQRIDNFPLADTLRRWVAPFDGRVRVTGDVALIRDTSPARAGYRTADGVRVAVQHNGSELWSTTIGADDYGPHSPGGADSIPVSKGDRLYFRVQSIMDGAFDQVSWDPLVSYLDVPAAPDVNGLDAHRYQASADFVPTGRRDASVTVPFNGTIRVAGDLVKNARTTDDITVEIVRNGTQVFTAGSLAAGATGTVPVDQPIDVAAQDTIALRVRVDSPIDVSRLEWTPVLFYTASPDVSPVVDGLGDPLVVLDPPYDVDIYPVDGLTGPQPAWTVPSTGGVVVTPQVTAAPGTDGTVTFTVKRRAGDGAGGGTGGGAGDLLAKRTITITNGAAPEVPVPLDVAEGDELFFDFSVRDPALALTAAAVRAGGAEVPSAVHRAATQGLLASAYRGWQYAGYNGNRDRAGQPVAEADLTPVFDATTDFDPRTARAYLFNPSPATGSWRGPDELTFVRAGSMSSSRLGLDDVSVPRPDDFAGARAVDRLSVAEQTSVGGGVSFLSGSVSDGSNRSQVEYLDLNGDRFPDIVSAGQVQYTTITGGLEQGSRPVPGLGAPREGDAGAVNVGVGGSPAAFFASGRSEVDTASKAAPRGNTTGTQMQPLGLSGGLGRGDSTPGQDLLDVNGDGLPDRVLDGDGTLRVALNLGYAFAAPEPWGTAAINEGASENGSLGASLGFNTGIYDFAGGASLSKNKSQTSQTLLDINGDGLMDRVLPNGSGLRVGFNTGNGFAPPVAWGGALNGVCRDNTSVGLAGIDWDSARLCSGNTGLGGGAYVTFGIGPLCLVGCYVIVNPGADANQTMSREEAVLRDVDGDGYVDHLASGSDSSLRVALNRTGRTNLLKSVSRPLGGAISLEYQRDGNTVGNPHSRWVLSRTSVHDGHPGDGVDTMLTTYQYDNGVFDRNEREFRGYGRLTEQQRDTTRGDAVHRSVVREFRTDSHYTMGLPTRMVTLDGAGRRFTETEQTYLLRDVATGAEPAGPDSTTATIFPQAVRTDQRFFEGGPAAGKSTFTTTRYDALGNVEQSFDAGDPGPGDDVTSTIAYSGCVRDAPVAVRVSGGGTEMRRREGTVDCATGNVTQHRAFLADGRAAVTDLEYFANGNLRRVTSPANDRGQRYQLSYEYDPAVATHVTRITDSFGYTSTADHDLRFGLTTTTVDINGNSSANAYDVFGRLASVTGPYETGGSTPTIRFEYHPEAAVPWALSRHLDRFRSATDPIDTVQFVDGLGRVVQTKADATIHTGASSAAADVMTVSGRVTLDHVGRPVEARYPVTEPLGTPGVFRAGADAVAPTRTEYDVLDRPTKVTLPDGTATATRYGFGPDRSGATQFEAAVTDANGNVKKTYGNVRKLVTSIQELHNGQPIWTSYRYDALDQLVEARDDQDNASGGGYDNLGRRTIVETPDAGRTESVYDLAGNRVAEITANLRAAGKRTTYQYDFNRPSSVTYPDFTGNNVTYTYGAPGAAGNRAGRVTRVTDESGVEERFYGKLGETVREVRTIATDTGQQETYPTEYTYDTFGRMQSMVYPDGEVLTYRYDSGGLVREATGVKDGRTYPYFTRQEYDKFGQRAFLATGNGIQTSASYDPVERRLTNLRAGPAGGEPFQNLRYEYDNVDNILRLRNDVAVPPPSRDGGPTTQTFGYDDLYRLTNASGSYEYEPGKLDRYTLSQSYDSIHNLTSKQQTHEVVQPSGTPVQQHKTTFSQTYEYGGSRPHAASHIGEATFGYDANGNQTSWDDDGSGQRRTTVWDEANRIQSVFDNGHEKAYKYDYANQRVVKRGPQGETAYVNQYFSIRNRNIGTKHVFSGSTRIASKLMKKNAEEKDQYFYHPDHLGSNGYITDADGEIFRHTEFFPSGEAWVDEASNKQRTPYLFAGKELDEETGLYYFGARYYDARTGVWQSPDPAAGPYHGTGNTYSSHSLAVYSYANDNPVRHIDPDGRQSTGWVKLTHERLQTIIENTPGTPARGSDRFAAFTGAVYENAMGRSLVGEARSAATGSSNEDRRFYAPTRDIFTTLFGWRRHSSHVVPDAVGDVVQREIGGRGFGGLFRAPVRQQTLKDGAFFEAKAHQDPITLDGDNYQALGFLSALKDIKERNRWNMPDATPLLVYVSTSRIASGIGGEADQLGIALFEAPLEEYVAPPGTANYDPNKPAVRVGPLRPLNRTAITYLGLEERQQGLVGIPLGREVTLWGFNPRLN